MEIQNLVNRLGKWSDGDKAGPQRVLVYPTNRCNLKCPFCFQRLSPYDYTDELGKEKWISITKELCEMGVDIIQISGGGEPMIVSDIVIEMMEIVKSFKKTGRLVNNGTLWTDELIEKTVDMGWDNVIFSVDGPNADIQNKSRGVEGCFEKIIKNIKYFNDYKKETKRDIPKLEFSTVLTNINYKEIPEIVEMASELRVENITIEPVFVSNPSVKNLKLDESERMFFIENIVPKVVQISESLNITTNIEDILEVENVEKTGELKEQILSNSENTGLDNSFLNLPCYEPWLWPKIEADGTIGVCSTNSLNANIKNKTFSEIWYGKEFNEFRRRIMDRDLPEGCENCVSTHLSLNKKIRNSLKEIKSK